ncbi:hypothetical protein [Marivita sp.]|uniref:hypothetical protein n=1 Tax=Marivita sp. TaxID=2003365 RepID=UPI003F6AE13C
MSGNDHRTAYEIGYALLDMTKAAYFANDFTLFARAFMLPHEHVTLQGFAVLETEEDLRMLFDRMQAEFQRLEVDNIARQLISAEFVTPHNILATAVTQLFSNGVLANQPFAVQSTLLRCGQHWRIATANYAIPLDAGGLPDAIMPDAFPSEIKGMG